MPPWLDIPFLDRVQGVDHGYIPQANGAKNEPTTDRIRLGDRITDQAGKDTEYGTLGAISHEPEVEGNQPYAITAGHVLASGDQFWVTNRVNEERIRGATATLRNYCL